MKEEIHWFHKHPIIIILPFFFFIYIIFDFVLGSLLNPPRMGTTHSYYHHSMKKNHIEKAKWGEENYLIYTNSLGFKDETIRDIELRTAKYRLLFLGDSFTEGVGYPYGRTFVGRIHKALDKDKYDVLNGGVLSYSPRLYYLKLKYLIEEMKLRIDHVIVYIDISDIQDEIVYESFSPNSPRLWWRLKLWEFLRNHSITFHRLEPYLYTTWKFLEYQMSSLFANEDDSVSETAKGATSDSAYDFHKNLYKDRARWTYDQPVFQIWGRRGLELAKRNMNSLYLLCRDNGIRLNIAVYPWPIQIRKHDLHSMQVKFWKEFSLEREITFLNYFPLFFGDTTEDQVIEKYFVKGDIHWNDEGHKLIAKYFLDRRLMEIP